MWCGWGRSNPHPGRDRDDSQPDHQVTEPADEEHPHEAEDKGEADAADDDGRRCEQVLRDKVLRRAARGEGR